MSHIGDSGVTDETFTRSWRIFGYSSGLVLGLFCLYALMAVFRQAYAEIQFRSGSEHADEGIPASRITVLAMEMEKLIELDPSNGRIRNRHASLLGQKRKYREAMEQHRKASETHNAQNSQHFMAVMQEKLGRYSEAEATMADCLVINPSNPVFNSYYLWLFQRKILELQAIEKERGLEVDVEFQEKYTGIGRAYGQAVRNWAIRAPNDLNAYLFLGNYYIEPLLPLQAYRNYLIGLASMPAMNLNPDIQIEAGEVQNTISQIMSGYAKPYKNLP